jgi:hypothetical protein
MNAQKPNDNTGTPVDSIANPNATEDLGGEPLEGSGFEDETPEPDFEEEH